MRVNVQKTIQAFHGLDRTYAESLIQYLITDFRRDPQVIREAVSDIVANMTAASADGQSLRDYFGRDPQTAADDILAQLPRRSGQSWGQLIVLYLEFIMMMAMVTGLFSWPFGLALREMLQSMSTFILIVAMIFFPRGLSFNQLRSGALRQLSFVVVGVVMAIFLLSTMINWLPNILVPGSVCLAIALGFSVLNLGMMRGIQHRAIGILIVMWLTIGLTYSLPGIPQTAAIPLVVVNIGLMLAGIWAFYRAYTELLA